MWHNQVLVKEISMVEQLKLHTKYQINYNYAIDSLQFLGKKISQNRIYKSLLHHQKSVRWKTWLKAEWNQQNFSLKC